MYEILILNKNLIEKNLHSKFIKKIIEKKIHRENLFIGNT